MKTITLFNVGNDKQRQHKLHLIKSRQMRFSRARWREEKKGKFCQDQDDFSPTTSAIKKKILCLRSTHTATSHI